MAEDPDLGRELTGRFCALMAERLQAARRRLVELYAYPAAPGPGVPGDGTIAPGPSATG